MLGTFRPNSFLTWPLSFETCPSCEWSDFASGKTSTRLKLLEHTCKKGFATPQDFWLKGVHCLSIQELGYGIYEQDGYTVQILFMSQPAATMDIFHVGPCNRHPTSAKVSRLFPRRVPGPLMRELQTEIFRIGCRLSGT